jgi:hypothetical protein
MVATIEEAMTIRFTFDGVWAASRMDVVLYGRRDELLFVMVGYAGGDGKDTVNDVLDAFGSFSVRAFL